MPGAAGVAFSEGTPLRIAQLDIDEATTDLVIDRANVRARQRALREQGRAARIAGRSQARRTLLDTATQAVGLTTSRI